MERAEIPRGYAILCRECGGCLDGVADDCCPACGTEFDPADETTYVVGPLPCSPYLAVFSALFVFSGPTLSAVAVVLGVAGYLLGLSAEPVRFGFRCLVFVPLLCVPGILLAYMGYERYRRCGQTVGVWVTRVSLICGLLFLFLSCLCGVLLESTVMTLIGD